MLKPGIGFIVVQFGFLIVIYAIPHLYDLIMMGMRFMFHFPVYTTATDINKRRMGWAKTNHMVSLIHIVENSFQLVSFAYLWCRSLLMYQVIVLPGCHVKVDSMSTHALKNIPSCQIYWTTFIKRPHMIPYASYIQLYIPQSFKKPQTTRCHGDLA